MSITTQAMIGLEEGGGSNFQLQGKQRWSQVYLVGKTYSTVGEAVSPTTSGSCYEVLILDTSSAYCSYES